MTDEMNLVERAGRGDQQAWQLIVAKYRIYLRSIGKAYRLSGEEIDDALQDTWLSAVVSLPTLRDANKLGGWLGTIMRRRSLRAARDRRRRQDHVVAGLDSFDPVDDGISLEDAVLATERWALVRDAVDRLRERDREFLRQLVSSDGAGYDRVARQMCMSRGGVGPTRQRVIHRLRTLLAEAHGADFVTTART